MIDLLKNIDAVIFDMDGTLVDSMWIWPDIDDVFLGKYHLQEPENFHEGMEGMSFSETAQYFLDLFPTLTLTKQEVMDEWKVMAHDRYVTQVPFKEGVREFIETMRSQGKKIGIATSNERTLVEDTLEALNATKLFDSVHTSCEAKKGKPAPDVYLLVADELNVLPERCLVFEDVPMGILAGKNAGMKVCAVEDDFSNPQIQ
ncbi:MAG: HAD family hydrolase, partial [Dorea sp.]